MSAFAGDPQPVEVFSRGRWYAGDLTGWQHDEDGRCRVRVRVVVDKLRHSAWVDLADLRLPVPADDVLPAPRRPLPDAGTAPSPDEGDTRPHPLLPYPAGSAQRVPPPVPAPRTVPVG
jgi:hypothetical protein